MTIQEKSKDAASLSEHRQALENQALVLDILTSPFEGDFFVDITRKLTEALKVDIAFITECHRQDSVRTIAYWQSGSRAENKTYELAGTVCETVVGKGLAFYASEVCSRFPQDIDLIDGNIESYVGVPLFDSLKKPLGHFALMHSQPFPDRFALLETLKIIGARISSEMERNRKEIMLQDRNQRLEKEIAARKRADSTARYLKEEIGQTLNIGHMIGKSPAFAQVLENIDLVAKTHATVLITGETGTGKELAARLIHKGSPRAAGPLVKVNCAALPQELIEAELFGHEKGAFTSAQAMRKGRFELADGGALFLDEIGEMSLSAQVKLLRVLQEKEFERVGGSQPIRVDFRLIAATNRDLEAMIARGAFREDLFYRLNVFPLRLPALRERKSDIIPLAEHFLGRFARSLGKAFTGIHDQTKAALESHDWPGYIRELENLVQRLAILSPGPLLQHKGFQPTATQAGMSLRDVERHHIAMVLAQTNGKIEGNAGAASILDLNPSTLRSKMKKLGICL